MNKAYEIIYISCVESSDELLDEVMEKIPFDVAQTTFLQPGEISDIFVTHMHLKSQKAFVAIKGSVSFTIGLGKDSETITLDSLQKILILPPRVWRKMNVMPQSSSLLVLSSQEEDENDLLKEKPWE